MKRIYLALALLLCMVTCVAAQSEPGVKKFPTALDDLDSLIRAANKASTTIASPGLGPSDTSMTVASTALFPSSGVLFLRSLEVVSYTSKDATHFLGLVRAKDGTTAVSHGVGGAVTLSIVALFHNTLVSVDVALETKLGYGASVPTNVGDVLTVTGAGQTAYAANGAQPLDGDLTAIAGLAGTSGLARKTAANTWSLDTATYLTGNQTITLSGDVSGTGSTAITATIGAGVVTNTMLAGAIADTKLSTISTAGKVSDSALSSNVVLENITNVFTAGQTIGSPTQNFWTDIHPSVMINRLNDRVMIGGATTNSGLFTAGTLDWMETLVANTTKVSQTASLNTIGHIGVLGASRASDFGAATGGVIGVQGFAYNNDATFGSDAFGGYFEAWHLTGAGNTHGVEIDIVNKAASAGTVQPFSMFPANLSSGLWLASGGSRSGATNASVFLALVNNGARADKGIVVDATALVGTDGTTGTATAIQMATQQKLSWFDTSGQESAIYGASNQGLVLAPYSGFVGIGTLVPEQALHVQSVADYAPQINIRNVGAANTAGSAGYVNFERARSGSTAVVSGDALGTFVWKGYASAAYQNSSLFQAVVDGTVSGSNVPSAIVFFTGGSSLAERLRIASDGVITLSGITKAGTGPTTLTNAAGGILEGAIALTDVTTNNATSSKHGFLPKLSGNASDALKGDGSYGRMSTILGSSPGLRSLSTGQTLFGGPSANADMSTSDVFQFIVPYAGTLRNLYISTSGTQPASGSLVATVMKNGTGTAVTVTLAANGSGNMIDSSNTVAFNAADRISVRFVNNATATSVQIISWSVEYHP